MADVEIVVKVDERHVNMVRKYFKPTGYSFIPLQIQTEFVSAILNGTLLEKGHGGLIDVDALREDFKHSKKISFAERMDISCIVDHAPIIIEADKVAGGEV